MSKVLSMKPFILTVNSDEDIDIEDSSDEGDEPSERNEQSEIFSNSFKFNDGNSLKKRKKIRKRNPELDFLGIEISESESSGEENEEEDPFDDDQFKEFKKIRKNPQNLSDSDTDEEEIDENYFNTKFPVLKRESFKEMNLSVPFLRVLKEIDFHTPTLVQQQAIPPLLQGLDVCASAETGSGKTAAFTLPILERVLHRNYKEKIVRVLAILPTRELALQCYEEFVKFAKYTDIRIGRVIGGESMISQKSIVKSKPDILVCTSGRLISHLLNTSGFNLRGLEILVLDEADRLLEMGFKDEMQMILENIPKERQSMLFSATLNDDIDELSRLSLKLPVRICCNPRKDTPETLIQEFVKIRSFAKKRGEETEETERKEKNYRESCLLSLCFRTFKKRVMIFVNRKVDAARVHSLFILFGRRASQLHGDLDLKTRTEQLSLFKKGENDFIICTDVASRGIDIENVSTVINFYMPSNLKTYIHRVGRTARIGRKGMAVSLIDESSRALLRQIVKRARKKGEIIRSRKINAEALFHYRERLEKYSKQIGEVEKKGSFDIEMKKAEYLIENTEKIQEMIKSGEVNVEDMEMTNLKWFRTEKDEKVANKREKEMKNISKSGLKRTRTLVDEIIFGKKRKKRRKLSKSEEVFVGDEGERTISNSKKEHRRKHQKKKLRVMKPMDPKKKKRKAKKKRKYSK